MLALHRVSVLRAHVWSTSGGLALQRFAVQAPATLRWERLGADLDAAWAGRLAVEARLERKARDYRAPAPVEPDVRVLPDESAHSTVVEVRAADALGLLHAIAAALGDLDLDVRVAKIDTLGDRVVDTFYVRPPGQAQRRAGRRAHPGHPPPDHPAPRRPTLAARLRSQRPGVRPGRSAFMSEQVPPPQLPPPPGGGPASGGQPRWVRLPGSARAGAAAAAARPGAAVGDAGPPAVVRGRLPVPRVRGPLVVLLVFGPRSAYVRAHAVESLNFNLSWLLYAIVSVVLIFIGIGILLLLALGIAYVVLIIIASVRANNGEFLPLPADHPVRPLDTGQAHGVAPQRGQSPA